VSSPQGGKRKRFPALATGWLLALATTGCVSGAKIRADAEVIKSDLERAVRYGAIRCAPVELATAEANLDFALGELSEGSSGRAMEHIRTAEAATKKALSLSKGCGPKQVLVREGPVVRIEETATDLDNDGILDKDDQCANQAEDKDGFQDEDGCPEVDNDGDGLLDAADKCPNEAGDIKNLGCVVKDKDGDGLLDADDKCPEAAEDKDAFQDEDGCPELDNDGDTIPDAQDKCPNEQGPADTQGCPKQYKLVVVKKDRIEIKQQIKFKSASAGIVGRTSFEILGEIAQALKDNPQIKRVRVEGHTDSVGKDSANLRLSQKRAEAVVTSLLREGVNASRLEAVGFGETKPIASNSTASGRQENRRTEFNILEQ
jgi:outer membrane protein OmpA-like peptidoglycan-associated protein